MRLGGAVHKFMAKGGIYAKKRKISYMEKHTPLIHCKGTITFHEDNALLYLSAQICDQERNILK